MVASPPGSALVMLAARTLSRARAPGREPAPVYLASLARLEFWSGGFSVGSLEEGTR